MTDNSGLKYPHLIGTVDCNGKPYTITDSRSPGQTRHQDLVARFVAAIITHESLCDDKPHVIQGDIELAFSYADAVLAMEAARKSEVDNEG